MTKFQLGVFGSGHDYAECNQRAYEVGKHIALLGHTLVCGGLFGVMYFACKGAKDHGGSTLGILPGKSFSDGNPYLDVRILTNLNETRNYTTGLSVHGCILIGGSEGTMVEAQVAAQNGAPVVAMRGSGGTADYVLLHGFPSKNRKPAEILSAQEPGEAVERLVGEISRRALMNARMGEAPQKPGFAA